jgi:pimeloyl-ACP methyl ester carboxylesterase
MTRPTPVQRTADLDGPFSWVDHGGPADGPVVVAVHGLGGSHANWHDLAPLLSTDHRVLAVDLAGHGRTPRAGRSASVRANCALLGRFVQEVVDEPVVLLGNSMGAAISVLHAAAHPDQVRGLALIGPALPRPRTSVPGRALAKQVALFAVPGVAERSLARRRSRLGAEAFVQATLELTCADVSKVSPEMRRLAVSLSEERANGPDGEQAFLEAARSLAVLVTRSAAYRGVLASVTAPGIVLQGRLDRLVPVSGVAQLTSLQPDWTLHLLDDVGHVPQIEAPQLTADLLLPWLSALPTASRSLLHLEPATDLTSAGPTDLLAGAS